MVQKVAKIGYSGRDSLVKGANYICDAVALTIGPAGQQYALEKGNRITNDGITVARELIGTQEDEIEERGAKIVVEGMNSANEIAGDASSTCAVLIKSVLKEAVRQLPSKDRLIGKMTPPQLIRKIEAERIEITKLLEEKRTEVTTEQDLIDVATVSVEDAEIGKLLGSAQWKLGKDGVILAEEVNEKTCSIEQITGLLLDNGFGTQAVINNPEKEALELKDVAIIYTSHTISDLAVIKDTLEALLKMGNRQIVIMARAFTQETIISCQKNMENGLGIYPLNAPYTDQAEVMQDLQAVLGGRFINADTDSLDSLQISDVGFATHVLAKRMSTVLAGKSDKTLVDARIAVLEKKREGTGSEFEKQNLTKRISQLNNGFALLKVGAISETERKYIKDKADDAVNAVRSAFQEGTIKGGGLALYEIAESLGGDESYILKNAIKAPYEQIRHNAGDDFVVEDWVRDSFKVTRIVLEKACSVAGILATAGGSIATKKPSELDTLLRK